MQKIFGIIGWIGTALVFGAVAVRVAVNVGRLSADYNQYGTYLAWAGLVAVLIYMAGQWREVVEFYKGRNAQLGTMSIVSVIAFLGVLAAINYLGARQNKRWDLTANQVYSLSDQTIKLLKELKEPAKITVYALASQQEVHKQRLEEFKYFTTKLTTEMVDPDRQPTRAQAAGIATVPTLVVEYQGRSEKVNNSSESELTNALIKVITGTPKKVYFTQGHGEKDFASSDRGGYSSATEAMKQDNYAVESLALIQQKTVPDDATVVVIAGPTTDFFPPEIEALNAYTAKGGKVLLMLDPQLKGPAQPLLTQFLADWGILAGNDVVLDTSGMGQLVGTSDASVPVAVMYPPHPITSNFRQITAYPMARSMAPIEGGGNSHNAQPVAQTSGQSWAESDIASLASGKAEVALNPEKGDKPGPITLASAASAPATAAPPAPSGNATPPNPDAPKPETRVAAFGDSDFASNAAIGVPGNRDLFVNTINWLAQQENLIAVRPRQPEDRRLTMTAEQQNSVMILSLLIVPGLVFAAGIYTWWRRR